MREIKLKESLSNLIRARGFTGKQKKIARDLEISEAALSHYLNGTSKPSFEKLLILAEYFDVSLDYLVYGELSELAVDPGETASLVTRQVHAALIEAHASSARRHDLTSRLTQVMVRSLEDAVETIITQPTRTEDARTISNSDAIELEQHATSVRVMSGWSSEDPKTGRQSGTSTLTKDGVIKDGPFLKVQSENLKRGIPYQQIVQGEKIGWEKRANSVRNNLRSSGVPEEQLIAKHEMKGSNEPIISTVVLIWVSESFMQNAPLIVYERFKPYFRSDGLFAYISIMDDLFQGGIPLAERYRDAADLIFTRMWSNGDDI